jgi:hypothetical protein
MLKYTQLPEIYSKKANYGNDLMIDGFNLTSGLN